MISYTESSFFSLLIRKSIINPQLILKNCMYKNEKSFNEVSTQCQTSTDEQIQVSQINESKNTQTSYVYSPISIKNAQEKISSEYEYERSIINPYSIIDRVNEGEDFLKFLSKQNFKLNLIYTNFIKNLQKYTDYFLIYLQKEHCLYGIYRHNMIQYIIILQENLNELRKKVHILEEGNKNFHLFQKHFHKILENKSQLQNFLNKYEKYFYQKQSRKYQQNFFEIYQKSSIQLRNIEQQRLLAIQEQMKSAMNLTMISTNEYNLFTLNNFDDLLNSWEYQNIISLNYWLDFPHRFNRSKHDISLILLDEIKQVINEYYNHRHRNSNNKYLTLNRISNQLKTIENSNHSITSNITCSHI